MADRSLQVALRVKGSRAFAADMRRNERSIKGLGMATDKAGRAARTGFHLLGRAAMAGGTAVGVGLGFAVKSAISFEKQLSSLGAVSDASGRQMEQFRKQAMKAGADTAYSALEAAQAQTELAKGGLRVKDIMQGGLDGALSLAAAGELELADAATYTVNAMKLFGLRGSQATHVADALATAANTTTADVGDFGMALVQGGSAAKLAGLSFNETVSALEALAQAGIKNSDAGTSLKAFFLNIGTPSKKAAEMMDELGLSLHDAQGRLKSLPAISENLRKSFGKLTQQQFLEKAGTLAGSDAIRTLYALYKAGPKTLQKYEKGLNKQGTAAEVAKKKQDNLAGQLERLKGSFETLGITVGTMLTPSIRDGASELEKLVNQLNDIAGRKGLSVEQKLERTGDAIGDMWNRNDVSQKLADGFEKAFPLMAEAAGRGGKAATIAFAKGWWHSGIWGKLVTVGFLAGKMGAFSALGRIAAKKFLERYIPTVAAGMAAETAADGAIGGAVVGGGKWRRFGGMAGKSFAAGFAAFAVIDIAHELIERGFIDAKKRDAAGLPPGVEPGNDWRRRHGLPRHRGHRSAGERLQDQSWRRQHNISPGQVRRDRERIFGGRGLVDPLDRDPFGHAGAHTSTTIHTHVHLDGKEIATSVSRHVGDRKARR